MSCHDEHTVLATYDMTLQKDAYLVVINWKGRVTRVHTHAHKPREPVVACSHPSACSQGPGAHVHLSHVWQGCRDRGHHRLRARVDTVVACRHATWWLHTAPPVPTMRLSVEQTQHLAHPFASTWTVPGHK